ncbi:uncharacterized protein TNCV_290811 [Trichonephila clavipes]|nr:uncharacterized protein TNCV_290811 [Trichonephila clavipes]
MAGDIYRDVILEQHVRLFRGAVGAELTSILTGLESNRACVGYAWPTNCSHQPPPTCLPELRMALLDEWCNIPQDQIDNLILSLPRRCKPCIASSGRHTPY